jgi:hypothetical protein
MKNCQYLMLGCLFALFFSGSLNAEEYRLANLSANYSLLNGDLQNHASGWEISGDGYLKQWLRLQADFDAHHQSSGLGVRHEHDFLIGPELSHRIGNFTLFAHELVGACHISGSFGDNTGFASVSGGGIDWDFNTVFAFRIAQLDYHTTYAFGGFQNSMRFSVGLVLRLVEFRDHPYPQPQEKQPDGKSNDVSYP